MRFVQNLKPQTKQCLNFRLYVFGAYSGKMLFRAQVSAKSASCACTESKSTKPNKASIKLNASKESQPKQSKRKKGAFEVAFEVSKGEGNER